MTLVNPLASPLVSPLGSPLGGSGLPWEASGGGVDNLLITEDGDFLATEDGDLIALE